jgi:hypothetical protein
VDAEHPLAFQRVTVSLNEVASGADGTAEVQVTRDAASGVRLTVAAIDANAEAGLNSSSPSAQSAVANDAVEVAPGVEQSMPVDCTAPCDRSFRVIAQLVDQSGSGTVAWSAVGSLEYREARYPSGAAISLQADAPITVGGTGRSLAADLPAQTLTLSSTHPVVASVVQFTIPAAAVPATAADAITTAVFSASSVTGAGSPQDVSDGRSDVGFREISPMEDTRTNVDSSQFDPFAGCVPGVDCVRQYLVTAQWSAANSEIETVDWSVHLSEIRLKGDPLAADVALGVTILQTYESTGTPVHDHWEGDLVIQPGNSDLSADTAFAVSIQSEDGIRPPVPLELMPNPGVVHFTASAPDISALGPDASLEIGLFAGSIGSVGSWSADQHESVQALTERLPRPLSALVFRVSALLYTGKVSLKTPLTIHWSVDLDVYDYTGFGSFGLKPAEVPATPGP